MLAHTVQYILDFVIKSEKNPLFQCICSPFLAYSVETPNSILLSPVAKWKGQLQIVQQKSAGNENRPKGGGYKKDIFYRAVQNNTLVSTKIQF